MICVMAPSLEEYVADNAKAEDQVREALNRFMNADYNFDNGSERIMAAFDKVFDEPKYEKTAYGLYPIDGGKEIVVFYMSEDETITVGFTDQVNVDADDPIDAFLWNVANEVQESDSHSAEIEPVTEEQRESLLNAYKEYAEGYSSMNIHESDDLNLPVSCVEFSIPEESLSILFTMGMCGSRMNAPVESLERAELVIEYNSERFDQTAREMILCELGEYATSPFNENRHIGPYHFFGVGEKLREKTGFVAAMVFRLYEVEVPQIGKVPVYGFFWFYEDELNWIQRKLSQKRIAKLIMASQKQARDLSILDDSRPHVVLPRW